MHVVPSRLFRLIIVAVAFPQSALMAQSQQVDPCRPRASDRFTPSADLYCLELVPAPTAPRGVEGYAVLDIAPGPFTLSVNQDGTIRYRPRMVLSGLPDPASINPGATAWVAWATTPLYTRWIRLGVVENGETELGVVALDQFILAVSAEPDSATTTREGPLILRAGSPSTRMKPPDLLEFASGFVGISAEELEHLDHNPHGVPDSMGWTMVPSTPGFAMLPAEMLLRPKTRAELPHSETAPLVSPSRIVELESGDTLALVADVVRKPIHGRIHTMLAFNGQIPGPLLKVSQGAEVIVRFRNNLEQPSTIHWHGVRLDAAMDGVPGVSQEPVPPGGRFDYTVRFPDAGLYWYHPHVREYMQQDLGLSGNIMVQRMENLPAVAREEILLLDDILIGEHGLVPYGQDAATHALMGRFGNVFLVNGEPRWETRAKQGETLRLWFTNAANTRTFNLSVSGASHHLVAADLGAFAAPIPVESVVLGPAERYAVDVTLEGAGPWVLMNRVRAVDHLYGRFVQQVDTLGIIRQVAGSPVRQRVREPPADSPETGPGLAASGLEPDLVLEFGLHLQDLPFVTRRMMVLDSAYFHPVEWSGTMPMMNWATTTDQVQWFVRDARTGAENHEASFTVHAGDRLTIRLVSLRNSLHAMQHPIHLHGQRFRILAVNGVPRSDWAWKDTVLLPAGGTADILVEFTNPGRWMLHCHIAEHMAAGMMTTFTVEG